MENTNDCEWDQFIDIDSHYKYNCNVYPENNNYIVKQQYNSYIKKTNFENKQKKVIDYKNLLSYDRYIYMFVIMYVINFTYNYLNA